MSKKKNKIIQKLTNHYRLLIINDDTYEEKLNFRLNRLNVYVWTTLISLLLIVLTALLIAFTPLRTYIPGYTSPGLKKNLVKLKLKTDSLAHQLKIRDYYILQFRKVLNNEISMEEFDKNYKKQIINPDSLKLNPSKNDSLLRKEVEKREKFSTSTGDNHKAYNFIAPAIGEITNQFDIKRKHFAIDIALKKNTPIKSVADGTVIFSDWTKDGGNTMIIEHKNGIVSVYKHNKKLLRQSGTTVEQGEVIALSGNSGEKTSAPHLHFELWIKGYPVNPENYIILKK